MTDGGRTALYRFYDRGEQLLLYVGVAQDPWKRWRYHRREKDWWDQVGVREIEWFESRQAALTQEAVEIRTRRPVHNIHPGWTLLDPDAAPGPSGRKRTIRKPPLDDDEIRARIDVLLRKAGRL